MNRIHTIQDLMKVAYGGGLGALVDVFKVDAPVLTTTTGVYNAVYGGIAWSQLNQEANAFGVLPKLPWTQSGWRVLTARGATRPSGGVAENASLPDTIKPTYAEVSTKPKTTTHNFNVGLVQDTLASLGSDDLYGSLAQIRVDMAIEHREHINAALLDDVADIEYVNAATSSNVESIDRAVSSYAEVTNCGITAGDSNIYSIDRDSAAGWSDAYVGHASNVDRDLTEAILKTCKNTVIQNGGTPTLWMTGWDTVSKIEALFESQSRFSMGEARISVGINGIQTMAGVDAGLTVAKLFGYPLIQSKDVVQDTISRIYLLDLSTPPTGDTPKMFFKTAIPTQYLESSDFFGVGKLNKEAMYLTMGELICKVFASQGKVRDLK